MDLRWEFKSTAKPTAMTLALNGDVVIVEVRVFDQILN
jgi:hypothetical protein